jgi:hypothetical protein
MNITTTINIRKDLLERLDRAAVASGSSIKCLLSALLREYMDDGRAKHSAFTRVCYQERRSRDQWRRLHLSLGCDEYEYCIDLRKVCKMSVSFLAAYAIEEFLDDLMKKSGKNMDSYRYRNYAIMKIKVQKVICWVIYWGIPRKLLTP